MGLIKDLGRAAWRKYVTDGVASSGYNQPDTVDIFPFVDLVDNYITALNGGGELQGEWDASAGTFPGSGAATTGQSWITSVAGTVGGVAFRIGDRVAAITDSASTTTYASNWIRLAAALEPVVWGGDSGSSTANAISITADYDVSANGGQLLAFTVPVTNTSGTVTIAFNGGSALTIKTAAGNAPAVGALPAGMPVIGQITNSGTWFRMISDQASSAVLAACEAETTYAEEWAQEPEDSPVSTAAGGNGSTEFSALHWAAKGSASATAAQGYAADAIAASGLARFSTVAALVADNDTQIGYAASGAAVEVSTGALVEVLDGQFTYEVAASGASDHDVATAGGVKLYVLEDSDGAVNVRAFGTVGDGAADDTAALQAAVDSGARTIVIASGTYDLDSGTLTLPEYVDLIFAGGTITNGTIACTSNIFSGSRGLSESITLTGSIANIGGVFFDWFSCEKATLAQYTTFINSTNASYSTIPSISTVNRIILKMLIDNGHTVAFGSGIYPFDDEVSIWAEFRIYGAGRAETLLWIPASDFLHYEAGGATYPYFKNITVESDGSVLLTDAWSVNAILGLVMENSAFISYSDHAFHNDYSTAGGTGCPIFGSKIFNCAGYAGAGKGVFYGWHSASNTFDNFVDQHVFFNGVTTPQKGIPKAIFYNSNVFLLTNSNITYAGLEYVMYGDRAGQLYMFGAHDNSFENNSYGFEAIMKIDASGSNARIRTHDNQYLSTPRENGYHYILPVGNAYIDNCDSPTPIYSNAIRNSSEHIVRAVTSLIDAGATQYRLSYHEPHGLSAASSNAPTYLLTPSTELATLLGMEDIYAADSANISKIQVQASYRMFNSRRLSGGYGTTAARPTFNLFAGYLYFDTTLGHPIWYDGSGWVDADGTSA